MKDIKVTGYSVHGDYVSIRFSGNIFFSNLFSLNLNTQDTGFIGKLYPVGYVTQNGTGCVICANGMVGDAINLLIDNFDNGNPNRISDAA